MSPSTRGGLAAGAVMWHPAQGDHVSNKTAGARGTSTVRDNAVITIASFTFIVATFVPVDLSVFDVEIL